MWRSRPRTITPVAQATAWEITDYRLVSRQQMDRLCPAGREKDDDDLALLLEAKDEPARGNGRLVRFRASPPSARTASISFLSPIGHSIPPMARPSATMPTPTCRQSICHAGQGNPSPFEPKSDEVKIKAATEGTGETKVAARRKEKRRRPWLASPSASIRMACRTHRGASDQSVELPEPSIGGGQALLRPERNAGRERRGWSSTTSRNGKRLELGDVNGFEISADGKKMIVGADGAYAIIDSAEQQNRHEGSSESERHAGAP